MTVFERVFAGTRTLVAGEMATQLIQFLRNLLIARLIAPEEFGLAVTFATTMSLLEMMSDFALDKMLIQAPEGNRSDIQATAHGIALARGLGLSVLILLLGGPIAQAFGRPDTAWAFRLLAAGVFLRTWRTRISCGFNAACPTGGWSW